MNFYERTLRRQFLTELAGRLPSLADNTANLARTQHLLFGTWFDQTPRTS